MLSQNPLFKFGGFIGFITLGFGLIYLGLRRYAQLLKIRSRAMSLPLNLAVLVVVGAVMSQLPHHVALAPGDTPYFNFAMFTTFAIGIEALFGALIARKLLSSLTAAYTSSLRLLYWYLLVFVVLTIGGTPLAFWFPTVTGSNYSLTLAVSGILPEIFNLYIGYTFNRATGR